MFLFECTYCEKELKADPKNAGKAFKCRQCGIISRVPSLETTQPLKSFKSRILSCEPERHLSYTPKSIRQVFSRPTQRLFKKAREEAIWLRLDYIGTENLLLAMLDLRSIGRAALKKLGISKDRVVKEGKLRRAPIPDSPGFVYNQPNVDALTPETKHVLEEAKSEAEGMGHTRINTCDILLGLLMVKTTAGEILKGCGMSYLALKGELAAVDLALPKELRELRMAYSDLQSKRRATIRASFGPRTKEHWHLLCQIYKLKQKRDYAVAAQDFENAANIREEADKLLEKEKAIVRVWQHSKGYLEIMAAFRDELKKVKQSEWFTKLEAFDLYEGFEQRKEQKRLINTEESYQSATADKAPRANIRFAPIGIVCDRCNQSLSADNVYALSETLDMPVDPDPSYRGPGQVTDIRCRDCFIESYEKKHTKSESALRKAQKIAQDHLRMSGRL